MLLITPFRIPVRVALATAAGTAVLSSGAGPAVAAPSGLATAVRSVSARACLDVPGGSKSVNAVLVIATCDGSTEQMFVFRPVAGAANTYRIGNQASRLCASDYRNEVRQSSCAGDPVVPKFGEWTLMTVDAARHTYRIEDTQTLGSVPYCMTFNGSGGPVDIGPCTTASNATARLDVPA